MTTPPRPALEETLRRIEEIRAVLDLEPVQLVEQWDNYTELHEWAGRERVRRIRAILDSPPPAPRVFLPGDDIPSDLIVMAEHGVVYAYDAGEQTWDDIGGPVVEIPMPSAKAWQAAVDRARAERNTTATGEDT